jgi:hypothetical protein
MYESWNEICKRLSGASASLDHQVMSIGQSICNRFGHLNLTITWSATNCSDSNIEGTSHLR